MASPPLYVTKPSMEDMRRGDVANVREFFEARCRITKESRGGRSGSLIVMRPWQITLSAMLYARREDGRLRHRRALIGVPRKNGKSAIGSGFGLYGLLASGDGAEVYSCAADKDQAKIVFGVAKRMVELDPEMSKVIKVYRDVLEVPDTGSTYKALSSEAFTKEGLNPSLVLFDELHAQPNDELYDVMSNAFGARYDPLLICITTAGVKLDSTGNESICYRLWQYGVDLAEGIEDDPSFFFAWWGSAETDDPGSAQTWERANPGYNDLLDPEDFQANYKQAVAKGTLNDFKTKRLNMWVDNVQAWLPEGQWDRCGDLEEREPGAAFTHYGRKHIVLGFDGSLGGDHTALVAATVEEEPKLWILGYWERPSGKNVSWEVPRGEVKKCIRDALNTWNVAEVAYDKYLWQDAMDELRQEFRSYNRVGSDDKDYELFKEFPQTSAHMGPATHRFYELTGARKLHHTGDPRLARHIGAAQIKIDERGQRLVKDARNSPRKIDLAIASVEAVDRAAYWLAQVPADHVPVEERRFVW